MRILIADDHPVVREGLRQILLESLDLAVIDEAGTGQEVLRKIGGNDYDVVLLDISMPGASALDVLKQLKIMRPKMPVLVLSIHPEEQYGLRVLRAGASGYLTKDSAPSELLTAVRKVSLGGKYVSSSLAEKLAFSLENGTEKSLHQTLSDREYEVMIAIASGKTTREISQELSVGIKTVNTYRTRVLRKMQMRNNAELIHYVVENELLQ